MNTTAPNPTNVTALQCDVTLNLDYDTVVAAICVVMGLFGLVYTFVGYRCFKAVMFLSGLIFGGTVVFVMCQEERIFIHSLSFEAIVGISIGMGVLCGFITMLMRYVGLFLQGFFLGLLIAIGAITALQKFYDPSTPWIPVGILFGTGILFSLLTLKWQKTFVIISTSVMGSALICTCLEYFMEKFLLLNYIWEALMAAPSVTVCWYTWVILGIWPIFAILGCVIQWKFTGKGYDHTDVIIWRGQRKRVRTHLVRHQQLCGRDNHATDAMISVTVNAEPAPCSNRSVPPSRSESARREQVPNQGAQQFNAANFDTLPPSYDDCVQRGIGAPVTDKDRDRIVRTKHGSFLAPQGQSSSNSVQPSSSNVGSSHTRSSGSRGSSIRGSRRGSGRRGTRSSSSRGRRRGRNERSRSPRSRQERQATSVPARAPERQGARPHRSSPGPRGSGRSRRGRGSTPTRGRVPHSSVDDRQSLLTTEAPQQTQQASSFQGRHPRASDAMMAHARRLQAAQERRGNNT